MQTTLIKARQGGPKQIRKPNIQMSKTGKTKAQGLIITDQAIL
jgi:hypothetical protein